MKSLYIAAEQEVMRRKDERKKLSEWRQVDAEEAICYVHPSCIFMAENKAGLTNHACQKHMLLQKSQFQFRQSLHNIRKTFKERSHAV